MDDFGTSEEDNDVNKYKTEKLKSELEELNRHLMLERIEKEEMRKKMSRDRDELISELRSTDETRRKLQGEIANLQNDLAKKEVRIEEGKRHIQRIQREHEVDIRDKDKLVQDKESEINRLGEFLDAYNGLLSDELKEKKERREDYFNKHSKLKHSKTLTLYIRISNFNIRILFIIYLDTTLITNY
jgi:chromosome segregation ATPase